jgi:hypothetical protein
MPEGDDGVACPAASPYERRWVPHPVSLARQRAHEAMRHAPASPPMVVAEEPPPKPSAAQPQLKGGVDLTATVPLRGEEGATGRGDAGGAHAPLPFCALRARAPARQG